MPHQPLLIGAVSGPFAPEVRGDLWGGDVWGGGGGAPSGEHEVLVHIEEHHPVVLVVVLAHAVVVDLGLAPRDGLEAIREEALVHKVRELRVQMLGACMRVLGEVHVVHS